MNVPPDLEPITNIRHYIGPFWIAPIPHTTQIKDGAFTSVKLTTTTYVFGPLAWVNGTRYSYGYAGLPRWYRNLYAIAGISIFYVFGKRLKPF